MIGVLFVCLGNICRSPMAEAVFGHLVTEAGMEDVFRIDSAGTASYHIGDQPHRGTRKVLGAHGIVYRHSSRMVSSVELDEWDYVIAMDEAHGLGNRPPRARGRRSWRGITEGGNPGDPSSGRPVVRDGKRLAFRVHESKPRRCKKCRRLFHALRSTTFLCLACLKKNSL